MEREFEDFMKFMRVFVQYDDETDTFWCQFHQRRESFEVHFSHCNICGGSNH